MDCKPSGAGTKLAGSAVIPSAPKCVAVSTQSVLDGLTKGQIPLVSSWNLTPTIPLFSLLVAKREHPVPAPHKKQARTGLCLFPVANRCGGLSFPMKEVSQGRGAPGSV